MGTFDQILLTFKTQPKIKTHVQNFEISKFELLHQKLKNVLLKPWALFRT